MAGPMPRSPDDWRPLPARDGSIGRYYLADHLGSIAGDRESLTLIQGSHDPSALVAKLTTGDAADSWMQV